MTLTLLHLNRQRTKLGFTAVVLAMFLMVHSTVAVETNSPPPQLQELLHQAEDLARQSFLPQGYRRSNESFTAYRQLITKLAVEDGAVKNMGAEEQTLFQMLKPAGSHTELFDELLDYYGHWQGRPGSSPQVKRPPRLKEKHLTETYRTAWEGLLLAPENGEIGFMQIHHTITNALAKIGSPKSIPVLEKAFAYTCGKEAREVVEGDRSVLRQVKILQSLNQFATAEALHAMFRCLAKAETAAIGPLPKESGYDIREWIFHCLTYQGDRKNSEKWRRVLETFPKDNLPVKQRELLNQVIAFKPSVSVPPSENRDK